MKWFFACLMLILCVGVVSPAPHQYQGFSAAEPGFSVSGRSVSVSDTAVYHTAYYALEGDVEWTPFELSGNAFPGNAGWLTGEASFDIPSLSGEHYVIVYSCAWDAAWDCHDGRWQLVVLGEPSGGAGLSLSAWVTVDSFAENGKIVVMPTDDLEDPWEVYALDAKGGDVRFVISDGLPQATGGWHKVTYPLSLGVEHFVVGTYDGSVMRLYLDGVLVASNPVSLVVGESSRSLSVGALPTCCALDGTVGEYAEYDRVLSASEVAELYGGDIPPGCEGSSLQPCDILHGSGGRSRTCNDGSWSDWSSCSVVSCDNGYHVSGNACVEDGPGCDDTCSSLGYDCGTHTICGRSEFCGECGGTVCGDETCDFGEVCSTCAADCGACPSDACPCGDGYYCSTDRYSGAPPVCLLEVNGDTFFVDPDGSDGGSGTSPGSAWGSWEYAFDRLGPGDILYLMGGEWTPSGRVSSEGMAVDAYDLEGTSSSPIRIFNYPGQNPVMNCQYATHGSDSACVRFDEAYNVHLKGFEVKNARQSSGASQPAKGIWCSNCANIVYERLVVHDIDGRGIEHADWWDYYSPVDTSYFINVDVYNCFDLESGSPGNAADAIFVQNDYNDEMYIEGCRAWAFSDDGINIHGEGHNEVRNSWSMSTDKYLGRSSSWMIEANSFKFGATLNSGVPGYPNGDHYLIVEDCIAANSVGRGITTNNGCSATRRPTNALIRNNLVYDVGQGGVATGSYWDACSPDDTTYINNIALSSNGGAGPGSSASSHNSWDSGVTVTESDFVSLDYWELFNTPRKPDGSLPDVSFGRLVEGSDLRGAGSDGNDLGPSR